MKRKSSNVNAGTSESTKKARGKAQQKGAAAAGSSGNAAAGGSGSSSASGGPVGGSNVGNSDGGGRRRNPHGIAPDDVEEAAKPTQRAFQCHIRMACGLLTAAVVLAPADDYIDHYDKRFDEVSPDDMERHMRAIVDASKSPNKEAQKRATRLIKDAKVIAQGDGGKPGYYSQIAKDIALIPAEHIALVFVAVTRAGLKSFHPDVFGPTHSTYNQLHRHLAVSTFQSIAAWYGYTALNVSIAVSQDYHLLCDFYDNFMFGTIKTNSRKEHNTPGSLSRALDQSGAEKRRDRLGAVHYREAKSLGYRKPILRMLKVTEVHSDDERPPGGDARKNKGLHIAEKRGRSQIVTAFVRETDIKIQKRLDRIRASQKKRTEPRIVANPPTPATALSKILPLNVPIDFWDPKFYNEELDVHEKALYIGTGVAFPLAQFCNSNDHADWAKMPVKEFMKKYSDDVLKQYNIPTEEELAALRSIDVNDGSDSSEHETTDLGDTDEDDEMEG
ncbi:hypothetical protein C8J57DRAFT_1546280 [Mycena rebaudengoi]|nr:hypothetical protein C8J57DRAFT_1546280 [Mycena rebaudengoi]